MLNIVKYPLAMIDITEAALYLDAHAGTHIALQFIDLCEEAFHTLAVSPGIGARRVVPGYPETRTWRVRPHPHTIIYRVTVSNLEIIRVIHGARDLDVILG